MRQRQVRIAEADRLARAAVVEAEASDERSALAGAYRVISVAAHYQGDPEAETYCQRAYDLYVEIGDLIGQGNMAMNLGAFAFFDGRWAETLELYGQSSEASRRVGDHVEAASVDANIAEVLVNQGHLDEAESLLRNGIRVLRSSGSPWLASFAEMQLGRVHTARGRHQEAEHVLRGLVAESYEMGVPASAYEVSIHLAECLVADGRPEAALAALDEAASRTGEDMSVFDGAVALMRGRALLRLGRPSNAAGEIRRERSLLGIASSSSTSHGSCCSRVTRRSVGSPTNCPTTSLPRSPRSRPGSASSPWRCPPARSERDDGPLRRSGAARRVASGRGRIRPVAIGSDQRHCGSPLPL